MRACRLGAWPRRGNRSNRRAHLVVFRTRANYFTLGLVSPAYVAIDRHATRRLRQWLCRKHKVRAGKVVRFPADRLWSEYRLTHLAPRTASFPWAKA